MLDESGFHGSIIQGKKSIYTHTQRHTQILVTVFYLKDKEKKSIYLGMSNFKKVIR